ncbi:MAG: hypothetical protein ABI867_10925 [Kofleriaceae bacterium]
MQKLVIGFAVAMSLASFGCKKKGGGDDAVKKMAEFKDAMCKCGEGDMPCAQKVLDDQKKYGEEMAKSADKNAKPDADLAKKMEPILAEYTKCSTKAMTPKMDAPKNPGSAAVVKPDDTGTKPGSAAPTAAKDPHKAPEWLKAVPAGATTAKVGQFAWVMRGDAFDTADQGRIHVDEVTAVDGNMVTTRPLALISSGADQWKHKPDTAERGFAGLPGLVVVPARTVDEVKPKVDDIVWAFVGNTPTPHLTRVKSVDGGLITFQYVDAMGKKLEEGKTEIIEPYGKGIAPFTMVTYKDGADQKMIVVMAIAGDKVLGYDFFGKLVEQKKSAVKALTPEMKDRKVGDKVYAFSGGTGKADAIKEVLIPKYSFSVGYSTVTWQLVFDKAP